ncbi:MAG: LarC family nickel insertion protein [Kiritimatiellae bacterium]|nr:LarC family nickel insertion protein [Kiritimatiellia bacterium]
MLYIEGASGISGDMTVGALLSLGASREKLDAVLKSLKLQDEFSYEITQKTSYGIAGTDFNVVLPHCHAHGHHHHHHHHQHRNLADVENIIDSGEMSCRARMIAKRAFGLVAEAEAKAHGKLVDEVHFHEVGAIDSIVDIVSAAVLFDDLGESECIVTGLTEGSGTVMCAHGELPVPVPAVLNIAAATGIPLRTSNTKGECVTPTGIALAAAFRTGGKLPQAYRVSGVGTGIGKRDYGRPAILRIMKIEEVQETGGGAVS